MTLEVSRIQALCFDVDGTLRDTDDQWAKRLSAALHPLERVLPNRDSGRLARRLIMAVDDPANLAMHLTDRLGLDNLANRLIRRISSIPTRLPHAPPAMIEGVQAMLLQLSRHYPMAVVTARSESGTMAFLDGHQLTPLFRVIVSGQTCRFTKPFPDPVLHAAQVMGVQPHHCLMIGDTIVDVMAGKSAGANCRSSMRIW